MIIQLTCAPNSLSYRVELQDDQGRVRKLRMTFNFVRANDWLAEWRNDYLLHKKPLPLWYNNN